MCWVFIFLLIDWYFFYTSEFGQAVNLKQQGKEKSYTEKMSGRKWIYHERERERERESYVRDRIKPTDD